MTHLGRFFRIIFVLILLCNSNTALAAPSTRPVQELLIQTDPNYHSSLDYSLWGKYHSIELSADRFTAYVIKGPYLIIEDISTPSAPGEIKRSEPIIGETGDLGIVGEYAYISVKQAYQSTEPGELLAYRLTDPAPLSPVARVPIAANNLWDLSGGNGYLFARSDTSLFIFNLANPAAPALVHEMPFPQGIKTLLLNGTYLYLGTPNDLFILNITQPTNPLQVGQYSSSVRSMVQYGTRLYTAPEYGGYFDVFDVTNPAAPAQIGDDISLPAQSDQIRLLLADTDRLYIDAPGSSYPTNPGPMLFTVLDTGNIYSPFTVTLVNQLDFTFNNGWAQMVRQGDAVAVASSNRLSLYHRISPDTLNLDMTDTVPNLAGYDAVNHVSDWYTYVAAGNTITSLFVGYLTNASIAGSVELPGPAMGIDYLSGYLYVAGNQYGLRIYNESLNLLTVFPFTKGNVLDVAVSGDKLYVVYTTSDPTAPNPSGLYIYSLNNPALPALLGSVAIDDFNRKVAVEGNYAYVAGYTLRVVDVSNPAAPVVMGQVAYDRAHYGVTVSGSYLYLTHTYARNNHAGLSVIDVSDPQNPFEVSYTQLSGTHAGNIAYKPPFVLFSMQDIQNNASGLYAYDVTMPGAPCQAGYFRSDYSMGIAPGNGGENATVFLPEDGLKVVTFNVPAGSYSASGQVSNSHGQPIAGVTVGIGPGKTTTTDATGYFTLSELPVCRYQITPEHTSYTFTPTSRDIEISTADWTNLNFTGQSTLPTYNLSGTVLDDQGLPVPGVTISDGTGYTTQTGADGTYVFSEMVEGSYTLTAEKSGYEITPASILLTLTADLSGQDFTAQLIRYSISGLVVDSGSAPLAGVTITDGQGHTAQTAEDGLYTLPDLIPGSYSLSAVKTGYTFSPTALAVDLTTGDATSQNFTGTRNTYTISGTIQTVGGPLAGVTVRAGADHTALTAADGTYSLQGLLPGDYTLTPEKTGYLFSPMPLYVTLGEANQSGQDFYAYLEQYSISGNVSIAGVGLAGVTVDAGAGHTAETDANGNYVLPDLQPGLFILTFSKTGYTFSPPQISVELGGENSSGNNVTATRNTYKITGTVSSASAPLAGVTIADNQGHTAQTAEDGRYELTGLLPGTYILTLSKTGYAFTPTQRTVALGEADLAGQNFTAARLTYSISGIVRQSGSGLAGVTISDGAGHATQTAANGSYTLAGLYPGPHTLTPARSGYVFTPTHLSVSLGEGNISGQDFSANPLLSISGIVTNTLGNPVAEVTISDDAGHTALTGVDGRYTINGLLPGRHTITLSRANWTFSPTQLEFTLLNTNLTNLNFSGSQNSYSLSGRVKDSSGNGIGGVEVEIWSQYLVKTAADGSYQYSGLPNGGGDVWVSKPGWIFDPPYRGITFHGEDLTSIDFTGTQLTYSISGAIRNTAGKPVAGAIISDGAGHTAASGTDGRYTFNKLLPGTYTLTPTGTNLQLTPARRTVTLVNTNLTNQDFLSLPKAVDIDLTVSLYRTPTLAERQAYEGILGHFADGIFEMSNGANKIRTIKIYQGDPNHNVNAHVVWMDNVWPCAHAAGYEYLHWGLHVYMGDSWSGGWEQATDPANWKAVGYTMAHEWGHYYYGVYDEYVSNGTPFYFPHSTDIAVKNSVMNSQWYAAYGDLNWLNFSIAKNTLDGQGRTAQDRVYQMNGWGTLARPANQDPRTGDLASLIPRTQRPELAAVAPGPMQDASLELPHLDSGLARSSLQIAWFNANGAPASPSNPTSPADVLDEPVPYRAAVGRLSGNSLTYPQPALITAQLDHNGLITHAGVTAQYTSPSGITRSLSLSDNGVPPDANAGDGLYTGLLPYAEDGAYTLSVAFDNESGRAEYAQNGISYSMGPNGETYIPTHRPVVDDFYQTASATVQVSGVQADDHGDTPAEATLLPLDNIDLPGRLDQAGDMDLFRVQPQQAGRVAVRISGLSNGMKPRIRILGADGQAVLQAFDFVPGEGRYFYTFVDTRAGEPFYVQVLEPSASASGGLYAISAGQPLQNELINTVFLPMVAH